MPALTLTLALALALLPTPLLAAPPAAPSLPPTSTTRIYQQCLGPKTHVCPTGKSTSLNVLYYDAPNQRNRQDLLSVFDDARPVDESDILTFRAFQSTLNATHLNWDVFMTTDNGTSFCFPGVTPGTFPQPSMLGQAVYNGTTTFGPAGRLANVWINSDVWQAGNTRVTYTDVDTGDVVGYAMPGLGVVQTVLGTVTPTVPVGVFDQPQVCASPPSSQG